MAGYRDLKVWQLGVDISLRIYRETAEFPKQEDYGLTSQLKRAAVSIPSIIAEGHAHKTQKELERFLNIAKGSLAEIEPQLIIATELGYLRKEIADELLQFTDKESRMLSGLLKTARNS